MKIEYRVVTVADTKTAYPYTDRINGWRNTDNNFSRLEEAEEWIVKNGEKHSLYTVVKVFIPS
jgi:hypothetical protein